MKVFLAALAMIAVCLSPLAALLFAPDPGAATYVEDMPPARFRKPTLAVAAFVPLADVGKVCGILPGPGKMVFGCQYRDLIVLPDPCPFAERGEFFARIACHETGHQNGWSGAHEP